MRRLVSNIPEDTDNEEIDSNDSSSSSSEENVTLNVLERQPRVTAGKRIHKLSREEAEVDDVFWGSKDHRTWEESESDSDVSYSLSDSDEESDSDDSELDEDEEAEEDEDESESEPETAPRKKTQGYSDPRLKVASSNKQRVIVRKPRTEPHLSETRHSARIRMGDAQTPIEAKKSTPVTTPRSKAAVRRTLTQAELMAEAAITEEWNKADLEAYVRYTQLSDKEKAELEKKRTTHGVSQSSAAGEYRIISRSFGGKKSEIRIESPIRTKNVLSRDVKSTTTMEILGQTTSSLSTTTKNAKYRHPTSFEAFNSCEEFSKIESKIRTTEKRKIEKLILNLSSLLQVKNV